MAVLQLLGSTDPAVVLALPDVEQGGRGSWSRRWSRHLWFVLHLLAIGLTLGVGVGGVS